MTDEWVKIDSAWDNGEEITIDTRMLEDRALRRFVKSEHQHSIVAAKLVDLCGIPGPGEEYIIATEKSFNAYACVKALLESGGTIDELWLAIYRISAPVVEAFKNLISGGHIRKAHFIISSFFNQTKRPEAWAIELRDFCKDNPDKTEFCYLHNHAKVLCSKSGGGFYYFEGSGNMSDNARIEQYRYGNDKTIYEFHTGWMAELISKAGQTKINE